MVSAVTIKQFNVSPHLLASDASKVNTRATFEGNITASLVDPDFQDFRKGGTKAGQIRELSTWEGRLCRSKQTIQMHLERRVIQLFIQAVTCANTGYIFREGHTVHQGFNAQTLAIPGDKVLMQAAHLATVPCLYAKENANAPEVVWLYRSGIYDESNATHDVLKAVNDADRAIDEKYKESDLRNKAVRLLNRAAKGELTPVDVSKQFALDLIAEVDKALLRELNPQVKNILELYRDHAELLWSYTDDPETIDSWLNLRLDDPLLEITNAAVASIKQGVPVSQDNVRQLMKQRIDSLPVAIRQKRHLSENEARAPFHFYDLYHHQVLSRLAPVDLPIVEQAISTSFNALKTRVATFSRVKKTNALLAQSTDKIEALVQELRLLAGSARGENVNTTQLNELSSEKKVFLRPSVYNLRYKMIYEDQKVQSVIKSRFEQELKGLSKRGINHLEDFFFWTLLQQTQDLTIRAAICKLFNLSWTQLSQNVREIKTHSIAHTILERHASEITRMSATIDRTCKEGSSSSREKAIKRTIDTLSDRMRSQNHTAPIDLLLYKRLFEQVSEASRTVLSRILKVTPAELDQRIFGLQQKKKISSTEKAIQEKLPQISATLVLAVNEITRLRKTTALFQAKLMKQLRKSHAMSQAVFKDRFKRLFSDSPMSDGTMSNLENGKRLLDETTINQIAEIFRVSPSLFYPSHFAAR